MKISIAEKVTIYLANNVEKLSQTKWNKIMFFIDGTSQSYRNERVTDYNYLKFPYGPVPEDYNRKVNDMITKNLIKKDNYKGFSDFMMYIEAETDTKGYIQDIPQNTLSIINKIIDIFGDWSAVKMSDFSHELDAWKNSKLYQEINLNILKEDPFLKREYKEANFGKLVMSQN